MKHFKTAIAVALASCLIGGTSMAAELESALGLANLDNGGSNITILTASGTLGKYIVFTPLSLDVNLEDLGGPGLGTGLVTQVFASSPSANLTLADAPDAWVTDPPTGNAAEIKFSSNSHLQLVIKNNADMTNAGNVGALVDPIDAAGVDHLPTQFRTWVKGSSVRSIKNSIVTVVTTDTVNYKDLGVTPSGGTNPMNSYTQPTLQFGHGPDSGIKLDVQVIRAGQNDHFGTYETSATITWSDID